MIVGTVIDHVTGEAKEWEADFDSVTLSGNALIAGRPGIGKTNLLLILIEGALQQDIPVIAFDSTGELIESAMASSGGGEGIPAFDLEVLSPGSRSAAPVDMASLSVPEGWSKLDSETRQRQSSMFAGTLMEFVGLPSSRQRPEVILVSGLLALSWSASVDLTLQALIGQVLDPPKDSALPVPFDDLISPDARRSVALALNGLLAASAVREGDGASLSIDEMIGDGGRRLTIVYTGHLSNSELMMAVGQFAMRLSIYVAGSKASEYLKALVTMEGIDHMVTPRVETAATAPILQMLQDTTPFGVGVALTAYNPGSLDRRVLQSCRTWFIGHLSMRQDVTPLIEVMSFDTAEKLEAVERSVARLRPGEFVGFDNEQTDLTTFRLRATSLSSGSPVTLQQLARMMKT